MDSIVKMIKHLITLILIFSIIFISGCAQSETITSQKPSEQESISGISNIVIKVIDQITKKEIPNAKLTFYIDHGGDHPYSGERGCWNYRGENRSKAESGIIVEPASCPPYAEYITFTDNFGIATLPKEDVIKAIQRAQFEGKNISSLLVFIDVEKEEYFSKLYVDRNSFTFPLVEYQNLIRTLELKPYSIASEQAMKIADTDSEIVEWKKLYPNFSVNVATWGGAGLWVVKYEDKTCSYGNQTNAAGNLVAYKFCSARSVLINALNGTIKEVRNINTRYFSNGYFDQ